MYFCHYVGLSRCRSLLRSRMYFIAIRKKNRTQWCKTLCAKFLTEKKMSSSFVLNLKRNWCLAVCYSRKSLFRTKQICLLTNFKEKWSFHRKLYFLNIYCWRTKLGIHNQVFHRDFSHLPWFRSLFRSRMYFIAVRKKTKSSITKKSLCPIFFKEENVFLIWWIFISFEKNLLFKPVFGV